MGCLMRSSCHHHLQRQAAPAAGSSEQLGCLLWVRRLTGAGGINWVWQRVTARYLQVGRGLLWERHVVGSRVLHVFFI